MFGKVGVSEIRLGIKIEAESHRGDDVAIAMGGVEDAAAVFKSTGFARKGDEVEGIEVERTDGVDGAGNLLSVGPDVLDRSATDEAGYPGQALDAGDSLFADSQHEVVPVEPGRDGVEEGVLVGRLSI